MAEHHELDELMETLEKTDYSSTGWLRAAKDLAHRVHHHLDEEGHEVFQMAGKALSEGQKQALAIDYRSEINQQRKRF